MKTIVRDCMEYLKNEKNLSLNTLISYERDMRQFVSFLEKNGVRDTHEAGKELIGLYMDSLAVSGRSPSTISRCAASIRMLYRFLIRSGRVSGNPIAGLITPKISSKKPDILTEYEVERLLNQPGTTGVKGIRDKAIICLLYRTGMKVTELISLDISDIDLISGIAQLGENRKVREISVNSVCMCIINDYEKLSRPYLLKESSEKALFLNSNGKRLSRQGIWKMLKRYSKLACPGKEITPYTLRHTLAANMLKSGHNLADVQHVLGNSTKSTLLKYSRLIGPG